MTASPLLAPPDCRPLLASPDDLTLAFQPIVDLTGATIAGYSAVPCFPGTAGPDVWFAAAAEAGMGPELEALAVHKALAAVPALPGSTFLTVPVRSNLLGSGPVQAALATRRDLRRVVVRLTGRTAVDDPSALRQQIAELRERGARIALDGAGSGLQQIAELRPQVVPLDPALVADAPTDPVRGVLAELVGEFAGRIGARLLADGLETSAELAAVVRLGAALGQGWLLGGPSPEFAPLAPEVVRLVKGQVARVQLAESVAGLMRPVRQIEAGADVDEPAPAVLLDTRGEPTGLLLRDLRTGEAYRAPVSLRVHSSADLVETLQRALSRPPAQRFDPVVVTDPVGAVLGLVRIEDLASARHAR